jgi:hypothetical protein
MRHLTTLILAAFLAAVLTGIVGCSKGPNAHTIIVVSEGSVQIMGETPVRQAPGLFYLFRVDQKPEHMSSRILGFIGGKAGEVYGVDEKGNRQKIATFDVMRSDEQLAKDYRVRTQ